MKTRRNNYSPGHASKDKKLKTNVKAVKELSSSLLTEAKVKRTKQSIEIIEKENFSNSPSEAKTKKSKTGVEVTGKKNCKLESKHEGKQSKTDDVAKVKRYIPLRRAKILKDDVGVMEENCITLRKGRGKQPKTSPKQKKTTIRNSKNTRGKKLKGDIEIIENKNFSPSKKSKGRVSKPNDNMERRHVENAKVSDDDDDIEILDENSVEFLGETHIRIQDGNDFQEEGRFMEEKTDTDADVEAPKENNMEMQEAPENKNQETIVNDDGDDDNSCPDEVAFGSSKEEAMENMKLIKNEIDKIKNERKEVRKRIQDRNILQKKQKKDKVAEIQKRKLPPQLLEYVSKLPKTIKSIETKQTKQEELKSVDIDEDEKGEDFVAPEEFISLHGSTEFKPLHLKTMIKKPHSLADNIAQFKQQAFFGNRNKRESVWELKSKVIKQAVAGKL